MRGYSNFYHILNLDEIDVAKIGGLAKKVIIDIRQRFEYEKVLYLNKPVSDLKHLGIDTSNLGQFETLQDLLHMPKNVFVNAKQKTDIEQLFHAAGYKFAYELEKELFPNEEISLEELMVKKRTLSAEMNAVLVRMTQKEKLKKKYASMLEEYAQLVSIEAMLDNDFEILFSEAQKLMSKK